MGELVGELPPGAKRELEAARERLRASRGLIIRGSEVMAGLVGSAAAVGLRRLRPPSWVRSRVEGLAEEALRRVIAEAAAAFPRARVGVRRVLLAAPLVPLPGGQALTDALCRRATEVMGEPVAAKGVPLYTDARHYAAAGVPIALYGAGPRTIEEANAHRADERLPLSDLRKATEVVALTLADVLGSEGAM